MYRFLIKPFLFSFQPETAHKITFALLGFLSKIPGVKFLLRALYLQNEPTLEREILGLKFRNPVGLAAGFDKDAKHIDLLDHLGFGFVEIGTITPLGQPGNPTPRLFRLPEDGALINRMGFNNEGMESAIIRLRSRKSKIIVGGNIGKNKITPNEEAKFDYEKCLNALYPYVDYFVVNLSSPNTPGLRELQEKGPLKDLLNHLMVEIAKQNEKKPLLLKIAPDLTDEQLNDIVEIVKETGIQGLVTNNTTISRAGLHTSEEKLNEIGNGGLSGLPLRERSNDILRFLRKELGNNFPIIGVGGIMTPEDAVEKIKAGADLIQVYTGYIYSGPTLIKKINQSILKEF